MYGFPYRGTTHRFLYDARSLAPSEVMIAERSLDHWWARLGPSIVWVTDQ